MVASLRRGSVCVCVGGGGGGYMCFCVVAYIVESKLHLSITFIHGKL